MPLSHALALREGCAGPGLRAGADGAGKVQGSEAPPGSGHQHPQQSSRFVDLKDAGLM